MSRRQLKALCSW